MRKIITVILLLKCIDSVSQVDVEKRLIQLSDQHQFIKMDSLNNKIKTKDYFFYKALFENVCNNPSLSNLNLDSSQNSQELLK